MFSWKSVYREIADKLPEFESKNSELVQLMSTLHQRGLKVSSVSDEYCPQSPLSATGYRERYSPLE
ncbi:MAG: hypothetical protein NTU79_20905 [Planctomycetota bacterium]|nr:hypothetical protein [Planctomycetota bacterium]